MNELVSIVGRPRNATIASLLLLFISGILIKGTMARVKRDSRQEKDSYIRSYHYQKSLIIKNNGEIGVTSEKYAAESRFHLSITHKDNGNQHLFGHQGHGKVHITSKSNGKFLCMDRNGELYGRDGSSDECSFYEGKVGNTALTYFYSSKWPTSDMTGRKSRHKKWFIALRGLKTVRGYKARLDQKQTKFILYADAKPGGFDFSDVLNTGNSANNVDATSTEISTVKPTTESTVTSSDSSSVSISTNNNMSQGEKSEISTQRHHRRKHGRKGRRRGRGRSKSVSTDSKDKSTHKKHRKHYRKSNRKNKHKNNRKKDLYQIIMDSVLT